ncbi:MAG: Monooxygenase [Reyranella sp.]|nr:Monooxygenase [Reyranella sp.]
MRMIKLGLSMQGYGYHQSGWLHPDAPTGGAIDFKHYLNMTRIAQRGFFDMAFLADYVAFPMIDIPKGTLGRRDKDSLEPLSLLAALSPMTENIGLVATTSTTFATPYHTARAFASIDHINGGRTGWNVVTSFQDEEARNFGSSTILEKTKRYHRAEEFVDVVAGLWNSFETDAFPYDKKSGQYFQPGKVRELNHVGEHFQVKGPLTVPATPQGRPIIVQAGASEEGRQLAARTADVVYTVQSILAEGQKFYADMKSRVAGFGRAPDDLKIMPGILPVVADTEEAAQRKFKHWQEMVDPLVGLEFLARVFGDLSGYPLDGPVPELRTDRQINSRGQLMLGIARRNNYTIRQMLQSVAIGNGHNTVIGTPEQIAATMELWFTQGAADGFNILPAISPVSISEFVDQVVPLLQKKGLLRTAYESTTLRGNLGLSAPKPVARKLDA